MTSADSRLWIRHTASLRGPLPGRGKPAVVQHARRQPLIHQHAGGEGARRGEDVVMAEPVECPLEVSVEHPQSLGVSTAHRRVDGHDSVMAATARPKPAPVLARTALPARDPTR